MSQAQRQRAPRQDATCEAAALFPQIAFPEAFFFSNSSKLAGRVALSSFVGAARLTYRRDDQGQRSLQNGSALKFKWQRGRGWHPCWSLLLPKDQASRLQLFPLRKPSRFSAEVSCVLILDYKIHPPGPGSWDQPSGTPPGPPFDYLLKENSTGVILIPPPLENGKR